MNKFEKSMDNLNKTKEIISISEVNVTLRRQIDELQNSYSSLQKKSNNKILELEKKIDIINDENFRLKRENERLGLAKMTATNEVVYLTHNFENKTDMTLIERLQTTEKEILKLKKQLSDKKTNETAQTENLSFISLRKENERLNKLIDQKELEIVSAETTINEQKLQLEKLSSQKVTIEPPTIKEIKVSKKIENNETNEFILDQTDVKNDLNNDLIDEQTFNKAISVFENVFMNESNDFSFINDQKSRLNSIISKIQLILTENNSPSPSDSLTSNEKNRNSVVNEDDFKIDIKDLSCKINSIINNTFIDESEDHDSSSSKISNHDDEVEEHILKKIRNVNSQLVSLKEELTKSKENENNILSQLKNALDFIRSFSNSKSFNLNEINERIKNIEEFLNNQNPPINIPSLFNQKGSIQSKLNSIYQFVSEDELKEQPFKELFTIFEIILTVNSLLFEKNEEITHFYNKVLLEKEKAEISKDVNRRNNEDRINYLLEKVSSLLKKEVISKSLEDNIEALCDQNEELKLQVHLLEANNKTLQETVDEIFSKDDKKRFQKKINELITKYDKLKFKYQRMKSKDSDLIQKLKIELNNVLEQLEKSEIIERELQEQKLKIEKLKNKKESIESLSQKLNESELDKNEIKLKLTSAEGQIQRLTLAEETATTQIVELNAKVQSLREKNQKLKQENETLQNQNRNEISNLRQRNQKLEKDYKKNIDEVKHENDDLVHQNEKFKLELSKIEEIKREWQTKIAKANYAEKSLASQLEECQKALKLYREKADSHQNNQKTSYFQELNEKKAELTKCRERFINCFQIENCDSKPLLEIINEFFHYYNPSQIKDYKDCCEVLSIQQNEKLSPIIHKLSCKLIDTRKSLKSKQIEINRLTFDLGSLSDSLQLFKAERKDHEQLKKWLNTLYVMMKRGVLPPNDFDQLKKEFEEAIINISKPDNLLNKIDIMRMEKRILVDERLSKLINLKNVPKLGSIRPVSLVLIFSRKVLQMSGNIQTPISSKGTSP
ncbi:hypothetical protein TRFO_31458 [Tritrichomonas foetus]|uniref:Uncharacterized protein n=1 Tax=Tritrichomonas foetus TaxID=1144522 RepID=A0A1J4JR83_9EUKA|nr:hypothetical protein TRFO_31458 [Tritrichomonas foetus]|eukprot:OHT01671.1 hypothetical protein TRFO_31458 [Tritrichomonas foetus]